MILQDIEVDNATYGQLIRMHLARGDLESSLQLLSQMQRQKVAPDFATFQVWIPKPGSGNVELRTEVFSKNVFFPLKQSVRRCVIYWMMRILVGRMKRNIQFLPTKDNFEAIFGPKIGFQR